VRKDGKGWVESNLKVVGRLSPTNPQLALQWNRDMLRLSPLNGRWFPKGVYKFKTWDEEQEWTTKQVNLALSRLK